MSADFKNVSLDQGKKFTNYQKKTVNTNKNKSNNKKDNIVNVEGFNILDKQGNRDIRDAEVTQSELEEVNTMKDKFQILFKKYSEINNAINMETSDNIDRISSSNPYLGKNIVFTNNYVCYVTRQGIAKLYPSIDVFEQTSGKNGCPREKINLNIPWLNEYNIKGTIIPTTPPLITGTPMTIGQACGFEGTNIYSTKFDEDIDSTYFGCYRNIPEDLKQVSLVPIMSAANAVDNYKTSASSIWADNNNLYGPWRAFDENPDTFWSSGGNSSNLYDPRTGAYKGNNSINIIDKSNNSKKIMGETLTLEILSGSGVILNSYSILPRQDNDLFLTRSPNTWYLVGKMNNEWYEVDFKTKQNFNKNSRLFYTFSRNRYTAFMLVITNVGNNNQTSDRYCVHIADFKIVVNDLEQAPAMSDTEYLGYTTLDACKKYAYENDYKYFGMQDYNINTGLSACVVSNDLTKSIEYGDGTNISRNIPIWSTKTGGTSANQLYVSAEGQLLLMDSNDGTIYWKSPDGPAECEIGGSLNIDTIVASYGTNCNGIRDYNVSVGNVTERVKKQLRSKRYNPEPPDSNGVKTSYNIFTNAYELGGDPAVGCWKDFSLSYSCGNKAKSLNNPKTEGQIVNVQCPPATSRCTFFLKILDDGNMVLTQDNSTKNMPDNEIWSSNTSGQSRRPNSKWSAENSKFGKNFIKTGEGLSIGDWIGSSNGSAFLKLESDGNLVLYTSDTDAGCFKQQNTIYGTSGINAIYQINNPQDQNYIGKLAYVDEDTNVREYSGNILIDSTDYILFKDYNSPGNIIEQLNNVSIKDVMEACNKNDLCGGFLYNSKEKTGWLKNKEIFPRGSKQYIPERGFVLGVKKMQVRKKTPCNKNTTDVSVSTLKKFPVGLPITKEDQCYSMFLSQKTMLEFDKVKNELSILGKDLFDKMEKLYNKDKNIHRKFGMNEKQFKQNLELYRNIEKIVRENITALEINHYYYNIEGMQNLTDDDIEGMLTDTELRVLQENYSYFLWTILAVGTVAATIHAFKR